MNIGHHRSEPETPMSCPSTRSPVQPITIPFSVKQLAVKTTANCWSVIRTTVYVPRCFAENVPFRSGSTLNLRGQEASSLTGVCAVCQVGCGHDQRAVADHVSESAEHLDLVLGVVGDLAVVLLVASESEEHHALDLTLDVVVKLLDGVVDDCTSLTADWSAAF